MVIEATGDDAGDAGDAAGNGSRGGWARFSKSRQVEVDSVPREPVKCMMNPGESFPGSCCADWIASGAREHFVSQRSSRYCVWILCMELLTVQCSTALTIVLIFLRETKFSLHPVM